MMSIAQYLGFELCLIVYSFCCVSRGVDAQTLYMRLFQSPAVFRYLYWLVIPGMSIFRWLFSYPRVVVGLASAIFAFAVLIRRRAPL